ncbi:hypothetical protein QFW80_09325 [Luteimonas sp. M1R5S18]|uniref:Uncharacterized protein n=1 Tax=Luteimonas rhizosphaericola TaxID=3042024 RepID=A0ABT6JJ57_9GAMM|nr:hypothetical protein [Luteimonas rhizosphaericola]MDH5830711.1 hypothetical protein [Luteimonas rhizosphaericola]
MDACKRWHRLAAGLLLVPWPALAGMAEPDAAPTPAASAGAAREALGPAVADEALAGLRGGEGSTVVSVDAHGTVDGNTASQIVSGDNRVDGGAFANAAGLNTVIQNSGSNVLIQNGTSVNVRFGAGP